MRFARASRVGAATAWLGPCSVEEMPRLPRPASVGRTEADPLAHPLGRRGHATVPAAPCEHGPHADRAAPDGPDAVQGGFPISIAPLTAVKPDQSLNMFFHENLLLGFFGFEMFCCSLCGSAKYGTIVVDGASDHCDELGLGLDARIVCVARSSS